MKIETLLANLTQHSGIKDAYGATHLPIYNTATFDYKRQQDSDFLYDYSRTDNPTRNALEAIFAKAENGFGCICTNTGIAAIALLFETVLKTGDRVLVEKDCYGGTYRVLNILFEKNNISVFYADFTNQNEVEFILKHNDIKLILCESPTNPGLKIVDINSIANLSKKYKCVFAVDNSMATFACQKPLDLGADFSVFSATKYVSGHGACVAGAIVVKEEFWYKKVHYYSNAQGRAQSPFDVFLVSLGLPTLTYRMKAQEQSAFQIVEELLKCPEVKSVRFPGLKTHPQHNLVKKQMKIIPAILTVDFENEFITQSVIENTKLFGEKVSFGTTDSRVEIPSKMSHATFSESALQAIGLTKNTVRFSIGLENTKDLIQDIKQAIACPTLKNIGHV
ncbi:MULTISPECIES: trans-sulfuration enzyme family protein [Flavobacterium]|uniref:cysteine-S-conjugate beta-lyase n=1 Tax=Flavobacterium covae TaxID=2906076 RepID=A0ABW8PCX2_9FLAO|nr:MULTISPECIES: PLP-dependent aspartate aminotransferase family protein [Flavobacterium]OXA83545.1 cystathionine gamma-synthase [Flavobacterium columnare NBRC 100251 = ATCC 23463]AMA50065.1 cystathionine gamma-synthase [Flavobacterium covae]MCJ1805619.1 PLP-dependent aspartate aminotransferase family protein [Flavobacterium covae]MCJ1808618.1 PLP-dependent aspartate aminotransferase family protein [Flavobacterium covae]OWP81921.1 cystathionine gamma-synthase [Flavobacterium covae]